MKIVDGWVEVWSGAEPAVPGRVLDAAGIEMRLQGNYHETPHLGFSLLSFLFKTKPQSRLLVKVADQARARALLKAPPGSGTGKDDGAVTP